MSKFVLEKSPLFPYIAWTVVIGFAFFVFTVTQDLKSTTKALELNSKYLEMAVTQNTASHDFNLFNE